MVTTSKDKVQCFKKAGYVTCKDNVTGKQLRKNKKGVNATPGTIRVKKGAKGKAVAKQKARAKGPVAARTRSKGPAKQQEILKRKKVGATPKAGSAAMKAKMAKVRAARGN